MTVPAPIAPYLAGSTLLIGAGVMKAWRPSDTTRALRVAGLPAGRRSVRGLAAAEVVVGVAAVVTGGPAAPALVAASYIAFAAFVLAALHQGWPLSSCGCFAKADTPPTVAHAAVDIGAAASALWWIADGAPSAPSVITAPLVVVTVAVAVLALLVWTNPLPALTRGER